MGIPADNSAVILAPQGNGAAPNTTMRLANTGTTESNNATALTNNVMATIKVGNTAIRVSFRAATGGAAQVATTDLILQAGERFDWWVTADTDIVYAEAADGASAYEAHVWSSSP